MHAHAFFTLVAAMLTGKARAGCERNVSAWKGCGILDLLQDELKDTRFVAPQRFTRLAREAMRRTFAWDAISGILGACKRAIILLQADALEYAELPVSNGWKH